MHKEARSLYDHYHKAVYDDNNQLRSYVKPLVIGAAAGTTIAGGYLLHKHVPIIQSAIKRLRGQSWDDIRNEHINKVKGSIDNITDPVMAKARQDAFDAQMAILESARAARETPPPMPMKKAGMRPVQIINDAHNVVDLGHSAIKHTRAYKQGLKAGADGLATPKTLRYHPAYRAGHAAGIKQRKLKKAGITRQDLLDNAVYALTKEAVSFKTLAEVGRKLKSKILPVFRLIPDSMPGAEAARSALKGRAISVNSRLATGPMKAQMAGVFKKNVGGIINKNRGMVHEIDSLPEIAHMTTAQARSGSLGPLMKVNEQFKGKLSGPDQHAINNITNIHEQFETQVKKINPYTSHLDPNVILKERNMTNTLGAEGKQVKSYFDAIRKPEFTDLARTTNIPLDRVANQRLSRHSIRRISDKYAQKRMEMTMMPSERAAIVAEKENRVLRGNARKTPFKPATLKFPRPVKPSRNAEKAYRNTFKNRATPRYLRDTGDVLKEGNPAAQKQLLDYGAPIRENLRKQINLPGAIKKAGFNLQKIDASPEDALIPGGAMVGWGIGRIAHTSAPARIALTAAGMGIGALARGSVPKKKTKPIISDKLYKTITKKDPLITKWRTPVLRKLELENELLSRGPQAFKSKYLEGRYKSNFSPEAQAHYAVNKQVKS